MWHTSSIKMAYLIHLGSILLSIKEAYLIHLDTFLSFEEGGYHIWLTSSCYIDKTFITKVKILTQSNEWKHSKLKQKRQHLKYKIGCVPHWISHPSIDLRIKTKGKRSKVLNINVCVFFYTLWSMQDSLSSTTRQIKVIHSTKDKPNNENVTMTELQAGLVFKSLNHG